MNIKILLSALLTLSTSLTPIIDKPQLPINETQPRITLHFTDGGSVQITQKTVWEKAKRHKIRAIVGGYTGTLALLAPMATAITIYQNPETAKDLGYTMGGVLICAGISYYCLSPLFSDENSDPQQEDVQI